MLGAGSFGVARHLAKRGRRIEPFKAPAGVDRTKADQDYQRGEVERSIKHCHEVLGLGLRVGADAGCAPVEAS